MSNFFQKYRSTLNPMTAVQIIAGIILAVNPAFSAKAVGYVLGSICGIWAVSSLYKHFAAKSYGYNSKFDMIQAILGIILCLMFFFSYDILASVIPVIIGFTIVFQGISKLNMAIYQKKSGAEKWLPAVIFSAVGILLGLFLIINPFRAALSVMRFLGIILALSGITHLISDIFYSNGMYANENKHNDKNNPNVIDVEYKEI